MKEKADSERTYDEAGFKRRAACICVRADSSDQVLMVNSAKRPDQWIFPGGGVEHGEESSAAALREAVEEAGVLGELGGYVGSFAVPNVERKHRTDVFVVRVRQELAVWDESASMGRQRKWFAIEDAFTQLRQHKPTQIAYLERWLRCP